MKILNHLIVSLDEAKNDVIEQHNSEIIKNMFEEKFTLEDIARLTNLTIENVKKVLNLKS